MGVPKPNRNKAKRQREEKVRGDGISSCDHGSPHVVCIESKIIWVLSQVHDIQVCIYTHHNLFLLLITSRFLFFRWCTRRSCPDSVSLSSLATRAPFGTVYIPGILCFVKAAIHCTGTISARSVALRVQGSTYDIDWLTFGRMIRGVTLDNI